MKLFYCYSPNLKNALIERGHKCLFRGKHEKTYKTFWTFEGTKALNDFLDIWSSRKK